jgi:hypothetical protein
MVVTPVYGGLSVLRTFTPGVPGQGCCSHWQADLHAIFLHVLPFAAGNTPDHNYALSLGVARRLDTGGLLKSRLDHTGQVSLLYQQAVPGVGQLALSCQLDPLSLTKVAPSVGFSLSVA